ncbi:hypothetical protein FACS18948_1400 [Clostridia bacterium]|nr:hypothetical protein FACS18948_1400 [Clostridia bacterium]
MPTATFEHLPEEKRQRILDAASHEFGVNGLSGANFSNIIKEANIARGSIYQYFTSKEDLYIYIFDRLRADRAEYVKPAFELYKQAPFIDFFEQFYLRDSRYLLMNPLHIELGKHLYSGKDPTSRGLVQSMQSHYRDWFLVAIELDKERGVISSKVSSAVLVDLFVHLVTDLFIVQSMHNQLSLFNIREHWEQTRFILQNGFTPIS